MESPAIYAWHWAALIGVTIALLTVDVAISLGQRHQPGFRRAACGVLAWTMAALVLGGLVRLWLGTDAAVEYAAGYLVEWSLSVDNLAVFAVILRGYGELPARQHQVLFAGILGAVALRLMFVLVGAHIVARAEWVLAVLGLILVVSGSLLVRNGTFAPSLESGVGRSSSRWLVPARAARSASSPSSRSAGPWSAAHFLAALAVVEICDILFAVDSVPAVFGVVNHSRSYFRFIVFSLNVFAVLELRSLYFLLVRTIDNLRYLNYGLGAILLFIGTKMVAEYWLPRLGLVQQLEGQRLIPSWLSLAVIVVVLGLVAVASLGRQRDSAVRSP